MVVPPGRAHSVLHGTGMRFVGHVERADAFDHLGGEPVGGGSLQPIFHTGIAQGLDVHVGEGGRAAGQHMAMFICAVSTRSIRLIDQNSFSKISVSSWRECVVDFRDQHAFAHSHRSVRNGALDVDVLSRTDSPSSVANRSWNLSEIPAGGNGDDDVVWLRKFVSQR